MFLVGWVVIGCPLLCETSDKSLQHITGSVLGTVHVSTRVLSTPLSLSLSLSLSLKVKSFLLLQSTVSMPDSFSSDLYTVQESSQCTRLFGEFNNLLKDT